MPVGRVFRQLRTLQNQRRARVVVADVPYSYAYDFTGSNGTGWTGWTSAVGTVDIQSNQGRQLTAASAYAVAAAYFNTALPLDYDIRVDTTITTVTAAEFYGAINLRAGSTSFTDMMQWSSWHLRFVGTATSGTAELYRVDSAGNPTLLTGGSDIDFVQGSILHVRISMSGQVFRARYWKNAEAEPSTWQIDGTDSLAPVGSSLSLAVRNGNNAAADDWRWDNVNITNGVTGTLAATLANNTTATSGGTVVGTLAATLGNATAAASGSQSVLDPMPYSAPAQLIVTSDGFRKRYTMRRGAQGVLTAFSATGTVAVTLAAVTSAGAPVASGPLLDEAGGPLLDEAGQPLLEEGAPPPAGGGPLLDENSQPLLDETGQQILEEGSPAGVGASGTVARTLANVTSAATGASVTGTVARTLQNLLIAASGGSSTTGVLAETMDPVVAQAVGGTGAIGSVARTLGALTATASGATGGVFGTVAVTLDAVEAIAPITDETGDPITDESGGAILVRGAEGSHGLGSTVAVTLANVTAVAVGVAGTGGTLASTLADVFSTTTAVAGAGGTLAQTLGDVTATTAGTQGVPGALAETLDDATASASGSVTIAGSANITLANVTSAADGTSTPPSSGVAGSVNVTLGNVTSAAAGGHGVSGILAKTLADAVAAAGGSSHYATVVATLADLTIAAAGTAGQVPVSGTAAVILANITIQAAGYPTVIGTLARTLAETIGVGTGSGVAGTVSETLDDVTSSTTGNVSITVYGFGTIDAIYDTGPIDSVFETGRIVAVAGSAH